MAVAQLNTEWRWLKGLYQKTKQLLTKTGINKSSIPKAVSLAKLHSRNKNWAWHWNLNNLASPKAPKWSLQYSSAYSQVESSIQVCSTEWSLQQAHSATVSPKEKACQSPPVLLTRTLSHSTWSCLFVILFKGVPFWSLAVDLVIYSKSLVGGQSFCKCQTESASCGYFLERTWYYRKRCVCSFFYQHEA